MFDPQDFDAELQRRWVGLLRERIDAHRVTNDRPQNTDWQTSMIRGRIAELKELLALAAPAVASGPDQALDDL